MGPGENGDPRDVVGLQGFLQILDQVGELGFPFRVAPGPQIHQRPAHQRPAVVGRDGQRLGEALKRRIIFVVAQMDVALANFVVAVRGPDINLERRPETEHGEGGDAHQDDEPAQHLRVGKRFQVHGRPPNMTPP